MPTISFCSPFHLLLPLFQARKQPRDSKDIERQAFVTALVMLYGNKLPSNTDRALMPADVPR